MKRDIELEMKALLATTGEAELTAAEAAATAEWRAAVAAVTELATASLAAMPASVPAVRGRQRSRTIRWPGIMGLTLWRLAGAAALLTLAWCGWDSWTLRNESLRLARLDAALELLAGEPAPAGAGVEELAERLLLLQDASADWGSALQ